MTEEHSPSPWAAPGNTPPAGNTDQYGQQLPGNPPESESHTAPYAPSAPRQSHDLGDHSFPGGGPGAPISWEQPGIIPFRPLSLGELLDGSVKAMRYNPKIMFGLSAAIGLLSAVFSTALVFVGSRPVINALNNAAPSPDADIGTPILVVSSLNSIAQIFVLAVLTGLLVHSVHQSTLGGRPSFGEVWRHVGWKGALRLVMLTAAVSSIFIIVTAVLVLLVIGITLLSEVAGLFSLFAALLGGAVALTWLMVRFALSPAVLVMENVGVIHALRRSPQIIRGSWWRVFGILLLAYVIAFAVSSVLQTPFALAGGLLFGLTVESGSETTGFLALLGITNLGSALANAVVYPFLSAVTCLLYIDSRIRREGWDVELNRGVRPPHGSGLSINGGRPGP
ncbi:MAG: hypothetical protein ACRCTR_06715 [Actinomycetota bacterium]